MKILKILTSVGFVKKACEEGEVKVKDHGYVSGKFWRSIDREYFINFSLRKEIPFVVHNFKNYD